MAINFDSLPNTGSNFTVVPKGRYVAKIKKAEMKQPKDETKPKYLSLQYTLIENDKTIANVFDALYESDTQLLRYKLKRFIEALKLPIAGDFELKDLCKMVVNKSFTVAITTEEYNNNTRNVVDAFDDTIYETISTTEAPQVDNDDLPFSAADEDEEY